MRIGPEGKESLRKTIKFFLNQKKSGVPDEGIAHMMTQWVTSLLETADNNPELRRELEK